jgi:capsular polysaccharide transport system permease protein
MTKRLSKALWRHGIAGAALVVSMVAALYWVVIASDRYVSTAHIVIQRTDLPGGQSMDFSSLLSGVGVGNRADQLLLRDHLLSIDMLRKLDTALDLRAHFSSKQRDLLSRMWFPDASIEWFHYHYLQRVQVDFDDYAGVLIIRAQAYDPQMAQRISIMLVQEGERFMNHLARQLAQAQVSFLEQQLVQMNDRVTQTRRAVLDFQNRRGLVSPQATAESIAAIVAKLEAQRSDLQTQRASLQAYLVPDHANVVMLNQQIAAVERQITQEQAKLAAPTGRTLNRTVEEFQRLEMEAAFAQDVYKTALAALEKGRIEATRTIKKVSILQAPMLPEYPLEPRRYYNTLVFVLVAMLLAGIAHLLVAIVRDHTD